MARSILRIHPEAADEAKRAQVWYAHRSEVAADAFAGELENVLEDILVFPEAWPLYRERYRRRVLPRFPFSVVYRLVDSDVVEVVPIINNRKRPGYWDRRR